MKYLFFFTFSFFYVSGLLAQVPLGQGQVVEKQNALAMPQQEDSLSAIFSDPSEIEMIEGMDEPLERVKLRDQDTSLILDMIQAITGRYILRPQNLPQVKINFDSMNVLTKRETLLALESLLAMNGIGITKIDSQFFKAVPATGINAHVPIWIDVLPSSLPPSQRIYVKMFYLKHVSAELMRESLNPFATTNVSSIIIEPVRNTITITDSLLNLQRMEKIISIMDEPKSDSNKLVFWHKTKRLNAQTLATIFESQWESVWKTEFYTKPIFILDSVTVSGSASSKQGNNQSDNNMSRGKKRNSISISSSKTEMLPENQLGIVCPAVDKEKLLGILDALDLEAQPDSDYVTFWYKPKRFSAETLSDLFLGQWSTLWVNEFTKQPRFMPTKMGDQLGITCHSKDTARIERILDAMDVDIRLKFSSKLVPLYHASAEVVNKTVNELLGNLRGGTVHHQENDDNASQKKVQNPQGEDYFDNLSKVRDVTFSEYALVVADNRSNGLFCFGTETDIDKLRNLIQQLDTPLPMARIDTIFVMVDLTQANQRGIDALFQDLDWRNDESITPGTTFTNDNGTPNDFTDDFQDRTPDTKVGAKTLSGGLKLPLLNSGLEFELQNWKIQQISWNQIFSLASSREDVRVFSTPSITVSHGEQDSGEGRGESYIKISDERSVGLPGVALGNGQTSQSEIQKLRASTELRIANPRIRKTIRDENGTILERGTVFMSVTVHADKFDTTVSNTYEGQSLPSVKGRTAVTNLAIRDGQIMVLGGFQEVQIDEEVSKYNFLSDIPYLGKKLFTPTQKRYTPTELMIFIRPTIIDPENPLDDLTRFNSERIDSMMRKDYTPVFRSPSAKILGTPDKKNTHSEQDKKSNQPSL